MADTVGAARAVFHLFLIKPSHYDDDGYVIQWLRSTIPSNTTATLYGLALDCAAAQGAGRRSRDSHHRLRRDQYSRPPSEGDRADPRKRRSRAGRPGRRSDQSVSARARYRSSLARRGHPRLHRRLPRERLHLRCCRRCRRSCTRRSTWVSPCSPEKREGRLDELLRAADRNELKPLYNFMSDLPGLEGAAVPYLPIDIVRRVSGMRASFDAGRGCPFLCSFCTIINVQGRKSRARSADDVERIVRANLAQGVHNFFITDDNLARNQNWEAIFDRLIAHARGRRPGDPDRGASRHDVAQDPALHREGRPCRCRPRVHRHGKHQPRRAEGGAQGAERDHRVSRDAAGLAPRAHA